MWDTRRDCKVWTKTFTSADLLDNLGTNMWDNINMDLKEMLWENADFNHFVYGSN